MGFLSNLFYKQKPAPAPKFNRKTIYLDDSTINWDSNFINSGFFEKYVTDGVRIFKSSKTIKLDGVIIDGGKLPRSKDRQNEKAVKLSVNLDGWAIVGAVYNDIPGGVYVRSQFTEISDSIFTEIGEDALSTPVSKGPSDHICGIRILNCQFYNDTEEEGADKSIQLNNAHMAVIRNCYITGGITGIRLQESRDKQPSRCAVYNNTFDNCLTAINADGVLSLSAYSNVYKNIKKEIIKGSTVVVTKLPIK